VSLVFSFVNSLTCLTAELEGRHYGGGVLELVPSEIERLLLPVVECSAGQLAAVDEKYRTAENDLVFLRGQDAAVLAAIGVAKKEQEVLFSAWLRLRDRRQRAAPSEEEFGQD
jgi:adenine-specific DNA-methyltransferase